jgi:hypothetical protein
VRVAGWSLSILRHPPLMKPPCAAIDPAREIVLKWLRTVSICVYKITPKHNHSRGEAADLESILEPF